MAWRRISSNGWKNFRRNSPRSPPPAIAIADAFVEMKNWSRLKRWTRSGVMGGLRVSSAGLSGLRLETISTIQRPTPSFRRSGVRRNGPRPISRSRDSARPAGGEMELAGRSEQLWLRVSKDAPSRREALDALFRIYRANNDLPNLYRIAQRLHESSPNEAAVAARLCPSRPSGRSKYGRRSSRCEGSLRTRANRINVAMTYAFSLYGLGRSAEGIEIMKKLPPERLHDPHAAVYAAVLLLDENQRPLRRNTSPPREPDQSSPRKRDCSMKRSRKRR